MFVKQLPAEEQELVHTRALYRLLSMGIKGKKLEEEVENVMNSKLDDLQDLIYISDLVKS